MTVVSVVDVGASDEAGLELVATTREDDVPEEAAADGEGVGVGVEFGWVSTVVCVRVSTVVCTDVVTDVVGSGVGELVVSRSTVDCWDVVAGAALLVATLTLGVVATVAIGGAAVVVLLAWRLLAWWPAGVNFSNSSRISLVLNSDESERWCCSLSAAA